MPKNGGHIFSLVLRPVIITSLVYTLRYGLKLCGFHLDIGPSIIEFAAFLS